MDLVILLCSCLIAFGLIWYLKNQRNSRRLPPGPTGLPFVGYLPFLKPFSLHKSFLSLSAKYGAIFSLTMGSKTVVVCNDPKTIKAALGKPEFAGRPLDFPFTFLHKGVNKGIGVSVGSVWYEQRRYTVKHLRMCGLGSSSFEDSVAQEVAETVLMFKKDADTNQPTEFAQEVNVAVFNSLWYILTGNRLNYSDTRFLKLAEDMAETFEEFFKQSAVVFFLPWLLYVLPKSWLGAKQFGNVTDAIDAYAKDAVAEHKKTFDEHNIRDFIDTYLKDIETQNPNIDSKSGLSEFQLTAVIGDMFYGGFETVSSTIRWGIALLAAHPGVQERMHDEIEQVIGSERPLSVTYRSSMPYTEATIAEIQRYASILPIGVFHIAGTDCELLGYSIPKDTIIISNLYASHYDTRFWENPNKFDPKHFLRSDGSFDSDKETFIPFASGKRQCPGEGIAKMELLHFMVQLVRNFIFELPPGVSNHIVPPKAREPCRGPPDCNIIIHSRM